MYKIVVRSERNKTFQELQDMFYSLHILMIQIGGGGVIKGYFKKSYNHWII